MKETIQSLIIENELFPKITLGGLCEAHLKTLPFVTSSRSDGIAFYKENSDKIDIVFLSLLMPDMYAFEGIKELLEMNPNVYIVGTNSGSSEFSFKMAKELGAKETLIRPYEESAFLEVIQEFLDTKKQ